MNVREVIIIGSGPAGYTAGLYLARAELKPLMLAGEKWGGQLMTTTAVENYPGFKEGVLGPKLMNEMREQAQKFGTEVIDSDASKVDLSARPFKVWVGETEYQAKAVVISTGAKATPLGVKGEVEFMGRGVSTCAVCDAAFFKEAQQTFVVGGGDAAMEEALALSKYANKVTVIHRRDQLKASKIMEHRVRQTKNIDFMWNSEVTEIKGSMEPVKATSIMVKNNQTQETKELPMDGLFIAVGHQSETEIFKGQIELDDKGYVVTGLGLSGKGVAMAQKRVGEDGLIAYPTMTSVEGVFAGGDVVDFRYKQAVSAAGTGCMAALDAEKWLTEIAG